MFHDQLVFLIGTDIHLIFQQQKMTVAGPRNIEGGIEVGTAFGAGLRYGPLPAAGFVKNREFRTGRAGAGHAGGGSWGGWWWRGIIFPATDSQKYKYAANQTHAERITRAASEGRPMTVFCKK